MSKKTTEKTKQDLRMDKRIEIYTKAVKALQEIFREESDHYIGHEFTGDEITDLVYVITAQVPAHFHEKITGEKADILDVNHLANRLIMQYSQFNQ